jgi:hypothetical protein
MVFDCYIPVCYKLMFIIIIIINKCALSRTLGKWTSCLYSVSWLEWFHFFLSSDHFGCVIYYSDQGMRFIVKAAVMEIS